MSQRAAEPTGDEAFWTAYANFLYHVQPFKADQGGKDVPADPCVACYEASTPENGCDEGRRLWGLYRLARIEGSKARKSVVAR